MLADELDYVVGVDTHRDEHALVVVVAGTGALLAEGSVRADAGGYRCALAFADRFAAGRRVWAVEGANSYGAGLTRMLAGCGESVVEAGRPPRAQRRLHGKSDSPRRAARHTRTADQRRRLAAAGRRAPRNAAVVADRTA